MDYDVGSEYHHQADRGPEKDPLAFLHSFRVAGGEHPSKTSIDEHQQGRGTDHSQGGVYDPADEDLGAVSA